ncbi:MAG: sigma-70 family RNA polymerase sigma factor [Deltaproteobacteria bacterium]|nr:sigma-70 family RNA polymerase sigma factor [Deltaproteobacteria bacterium]
MNLDAGELFERYHGVVYRRCLALLRDPEDAAEAVQEVFERAVSGLGRFRLRASPLTWLYAIATRHCLQQVRNRSAHTLKHALLAADPAAFEPNLAARTDLDRALAELSEQDLELVAYAYRDGMTQDEIAEVVRLSRKTVGKRLRDLSERLQLALEASSGAAEARELKSAVG